MCFRPLEGPLCVCVHAKSLQLYLTLCDLVDCSLPGSSVHGILQARILEWVAVPSSRGSSCIIRDGLILHMGKWLGTYCVSSPLILIPVLIGPIFKMRKLRLRMKGLEPELQATT